MTFTGSEQSVVSAGQEIPLKVALHYRGRKIYCPFCGKDNDFLLRPVDVFKLNAVCGCGCVIPEEAAKIIFEKTFGEKSTGGERS